MTAQTINLNKARKLKARAEADAEAMKNRAKFGRTKVQKQADMSDAAKAVRDLNGHKRDR